MSTFGASFSLVESRVFAAPTLTAAQSLLLLSPPPSSSLLPFLLPPSLPPPPSFPPWHATTRRRYIRGGVQEARDLALAVHASIMADTNMTQRLRRLQQTLQHTLHPPSQTPQRPLAKISEGDSASGRGGPSVKCARGVDVGDSSLGGKDGEVVCWSAGGGHWSGGGNCSSARLSSNAAPSARHRVLVSLRDLLLSVLGISMLNVCVCVCVCVCLFVSLSLSVCVPHVYLCMCMYYIYTSHRHVHMRLATPLIPPPSCRLSSCWHHHRPHRLCRSPCGHHQRA